MASDREEEKRVVQGIREEKEEDEELVLMKEGRRTHNGEMEEPNQDTKREEGGIELGEVAKHEQQQSQPPPPAWPNDNDGPSKEQLPSAPPTGCLSSPQLVISLRRCL